MRTHIEVYGHIYRGMRHMLLKRVELAEAYVNADVGA
jgi:hypothetical protein